MAVVDEELDAIIAQRESERELKATDIYNDEASAAIAVTDNSGGNANGIDVDDYADLSRPSVADAVTAANINLMGQASVDDDAFLATAKEQAKETFTAYSQVEKEKAALAKDSVQLEREKIAIKRQGNDHIAKADRWSIAGKRREAHFSGLKPLMDFLHIKSPMNLLFLYLITLFTIWFYIIRLIVGGVVQMLIDIFIAPFIRLKNESAEPNKNSNKVKEIDSNYDD